MPPKRTAAAAKAAAAASSSRASTPSRRSSTPVVSAKPHSEQEHDEVEYEFLGPIGTFALLFILPAVVYFLYFSCNAQGCATVYPTVTFPDSAKRLPTLVELFSVRGTLIFLGWMLFQAVLYIALPGKWIQGTELRDGSRLWYKMNGFPAFVISIGGSVGGHYLGIFDLGVVSDEFITIMSASIVFSFALSTYLYVRSFGEGKMLSIPGNTGNHAYDFFMGRELNPRIGDFDLKVFCELRPGLIGWCVIDLAMAARQYSDLGRVTNSMVLVCLFQIYYVMDSFLAEPALLTTMDVIVEGFGFMLAFGDLAWVPGTYTTQARYLVSNPLDLSWSMVAIILATNLLGYYIFRSANSQKDAFRKNPNDPALAHLKFLNTKRGTRLLISGWWGIARHINYLGDMIMGLAWCLPCGFEHIIPYFYAIYFTILLIHRDLRDGHACSKKYGKDWDKYCERVRWRIVPYVY